jgi:hypothetical protein
MSTPQTDSYWRWQQDIVEDYDKMIVSMKDPALHDALRKIVANPDIHEATKGQCRALYSTWKDTQLDHYDDDTAYKQERETDYAEQQNAPSEGFTI